MRLGSIENIVGKLFKLQLRITRKLGLHISKGTSCIFFIRIQKCSGFGGGEGYEEDHCSNTGKSFKKLKRGEDDKKEYRVYESHVKLAW